MMTPSNWKLTAGWIVALFLVKCGTLHAQIANNHPFDTNIDLDPDVIFTEMFEGDPSNLVSGGSWNNVSPNPLNVLADPSVPTNSPGQQSLRLRTIQDGTNQNQNSLLYKLITPDITDSIYVRYYVKYETNTIYHHSGLWVGGKNPPSTIQGNIGGTLPQGDQEFHVGTEIKGVANVQATNNSLFGLYTYWMGMHQSSGPQYYGNEFFNTTTNDNIDMASWNCIEVMVKLNNPVSSTNGAVKLWVNGNLVSNLGYLYPTGTWLNNYFTEGPGVPFEGFQFRNDNALNLNYIWLRNFNDMNPNGHIGNIYFDHLVVAKKYIGPISTGTGVGLDANDPSAFVSIYPNPADASVQFSVPIEEVRVFDVFGKLILHNAHLTEISTADFQDGVYLLQLDHSFHKILVQH